MFRNRLDSVYAERTVLAVLSVFVIVISFSPLFRLILTAVAPQGDLDLQRIITLLGKKKIFLATVNTIKIAFFSAIFSTIIGTLSATLVALTNLRFKVFFVFMFILPMIVPPQVTALAWIQALAPNSFLAQMLGISFSYVGHPLFSLSGIVILLGITNAPLVFLSVRASLRRMPADLVEAAQAAGAKPLPLYLTIVLPLARMGILAGFVLAFISAAGNFGIQAMLGIPARIPTLITQIYQKLSEFGPSALPDMAVLSVVIAMVTVAGLVVAGRFGHGKDVKIEGSPQPIGWSLGSFSLPIEVVCLFYSITTILIPISALVVNSLLSAIGQSFTWENITLENYYAALFKHEAIPHAFGTSLFLTLFGCLILLVLSLLLAYFLVCRRGFFIRALHTGTEIAYVLPGIVIGVASILFFLKPLPFFGVSIYGTIWLILAAYLSHFLALVLRPTMAGIAQIDRSLDEAAQVFGAGFLARIKDVAAPLAAPSLAAGFIISFLTMINEIQVSILLVTSRTSTIGPTIIFLEESNASTLSAAVGCLMIIMLLIFMIGASLFSKYLPEGVLPWQS